MKKIAQEIQFVLDLAKFHSMLVKRFDGGMGNGIGFSEFLLLHYLMRAEDKKLRRTDLAEKIEMTASGVTRMLLPMEKIGLVKSLSDSQDARVKFVTITKGGKEKYSEALERLEFLLQSAFQDTKAKDIQQLSQHILAIGARIAMR